MINRIAAPGGADIEEALKLADFGLGKGYLIGSDFTDPRAISRVALDGGVVTGFALSQIIDTKALLAKYPKLKSCVSDLESQLGIFRSVVVAEGRRDKGIASALMKESLHELSKKGVSVILMLGWKHGGEVPIGKLATKFKFKQVARIPGLWTESSIEEGFTCPVCGPPPCKCEAIVYTLVLAGSQ